MPVSGLDGGPVQNEEDQQQSKPSFERGALVLNCADQHAGQCRMC